MKLFLPKNKYSHKNIGLLGCFFCLYCLTAKSQSVSSISNTMVYKTSLNKDSVVSMADSLHSADIKRYYTLAIQYKNGGAVPMDYNKAFYYFSKAADLGDAQSIYAIAYMHYKGLGTTQDYGLAARLFAQGAYLGRDNSEYFYGLCLRNGYGVKQNEDSAQYWLKKSAGLGYKQAILELQSKVPENGNVEAKQLIQRIYNSAIPEQVPLNQFIAVQPQKPDSGIIAGQYEGYIIQYDWSGKYLVSTKKLRVFLEPTTNNQKSGLTGKWVEEGADSIIVNATLERDSLVFADTRYQRKDHYSLDRGIQYDFKDASLNLVRKNDTVYLAGNIYMFSPDRKEPSKPLFVALVRTADKSIKDSSYTKAAKLLNVYPNPFTTYLNVEFEVKTQTEVGIELYDIMGQKAYAQPPQPLNAGIYEIRIEPSINLVNQTYILRLVFPRSEEVAKVIKKQ